MIVRFALSLSQLSVASTFAGGGRLEEQETVIFDGRENASKTGGNRSINDMVKPNREELPKLSRAW